MAKSGDVDGPQQALDVPVTAGEPSPWRPLHIVMVGQKGLPATYGGVEHHVEEIGQRLAERGHRVTVYNRESYGPLPPVPYRGMDVKLAPTIASKHLDAIVHSATSTALALRHGCDIIHYHALGPGLVAPLPRYASRTGVVLTVHGLDHQRGKWGGVAQSVLSLAYWMSARVPQETIVVSQALADRYRDERGRSVDYIPNGVALPAPVPADVLAELGVRAREYLLFVGRMVPEKAPAELLRAYRDVDSSLQLVLVGGSSFTDEYTRQVQELADADPRVVFLGYIHGDRLQALYQHARAFVLPSLLEGLPLTLLEAVSSAVPVVASDIAPNVEVLGEAGPCHVFFEAGNWDSLRGCLAATAGAEPPTADELQRFRDGILQQYNWDHVTDLLEQVYLRAAKRQKAT
ncbi:MAG TPA: glycosyltransferase family 4 protein [Nocardioidaceae bacterium]|nr:glycosyltransferase family 4 protein [Nocardioidaceae bacterium]